MGKKNAIVLTVTVLAVAGFYLYLYRDSFKKRDIQIFHTIRLDSAALRHRPAAGGGDETPNVITFGMGTDYKLTSIKIIPVEALKTNKYAVPIWELESTSNSAPIKAFSYGEHIYGMHPPSKGAQPEPLQPNVTYRLLVKAGSKTGEHDFTIKEDDHLAQ
jgi:hypothetical protein